jgi:hypothetical protein
VPLKSVGNIDSCRNESRKRYIESDFTSSRLYI